ncbi:MAG: PKD domain-containing protein [Candidatus Levyibacteriota bacterium]
MNILKNKYFIIGNILLLLAVIPITLYVVKRQTDMKSKAAPNTVISFNPNSASTTIGQNVSLDVMADPGQNLVSIVEMTIKVDPNIFQIVSLDRNSAAFPGRLKGPTINNDGTVNLSVTTTNDVTKALQAKTKVATLVLKAKAATNGASQIRFSAAPATQAFSIAGADGATENVLSDMGTASVTVAGAAQVSQSSKPTCTSLTIDKANSGIAPYNLTFTGVGTASAGTTISKTTFNFGDATVLDASNSAAIGGNGVSAQMQHTYPNPGSFTATFTLTDNNGSVSDIGPCTQNITVASNVVVATDTPTLAPSPTPTEIVMAPTATSTPSATPTLPITGTLETTITILGIAGATIGIGLFLFIL